ncbi:MAG: hypothetical protein ACJA2N_000948 [Salibacteraceae bacterium]|jgi:hypothetical protein
MHSNTRITFFVLALFVLVLNYFFAPGNIISWDVYGYYLYLPTTLIYHDLGMLNEGVILDLMEQYKSSATFYQGMKMPEGNYVMKYSMGMAFLYLPFFLVGWWAAIMFDFPIDGFSLPFQYALFLGSIIYSIIGLWVLTKVLDRFFSWKVASFVLLLIVIGTNYMVHIGMYGQNAMSQNYLFTGYALVLWWTIKWHDLYKNKYSVALAIVIGLMALSRPTEIVVLAIPVLWGVYSKDTLLQKWNTLWANRNQVFTFGLIIFSIGLLQLVYWKMYAGKFVYNSYGGNPGEGLELLSPFTNEFLFSFRKGWIVYTPIIVFAVIGFYHLYNRNRSIFYSISVFFVLNLYLVSSWSNWWYAQSFSQRAMVSSYPIMAIGLGYFIVWLLDQKPYIKLSIGSIIFLLVGLNVFQTIQFNIGVLHADRMTTEYYMATFGKLSASPEDKKLLLVDRNYTGTDAFTNEAEYDRQVLTSLDFANEMAHLGRTDCCSFKLDPETIYSPVIEAEYKDITNRDHVWFRVTGYVFLPDSMETDDFILVVHFAHKGYAYNYKTVKSNSLDLKLGEWNKLSFDYLSPEVRNGHDQFRALLWYRGENSVLFDDFQVEFFEEK